MTREGPRTEIRAAGRTPPVIVEIALPESPTTGYLWELAEPPAGVCEHDKVFVGPNERIAGGGGTRVFKVELGAMGRYELEFHLRRPWEGDPLERRVVEVVIED